MLVLVTVLAPVLECFDRWDRPGLGNDTEFGLFAFVFFLCLVLLVALLVSKHALRVDVIRERITYPCARVRPTLSEHKRLPFRPPPFPTPLRI